MTKEDAIEILERQRITAEELINGSQVFAKEIEAYNMAIEALKREPSDDLIKRSDAIEAIEVVGWYHQNRNKDMVSGANSDEHQAWYKVDDVYKALEAVPSMRGNDNE